MRESRACAGRLDRAAYRDSGTPPRDIGRRAGGTCGSSGLEKLRPEIERASIAIAQSGVGRTTVEETLDETVAQLETMRQRAGLYASDERSRDATERGAPSLARAEEVKGDMSTVRNRSRRSKTKGCNAECEEEKNATVRAYESILEWV